MRMNAGYLTLLLMLVALILFASGWKDIILRGITPTSLLLFFVFWAFAMRWSVDWNGVKIYGCLVPIGLVIAAGLYRTRGWLLRLHLLSVGLLIGSISFFLKETVRMMPHLLWLGSKLSDGILFGSLTAVLLRTPMTQLAAVSLGLLAGEGLYGISHHHDKPMVWGRPEFQDEWWMTVFFVRGFSLLMTGAALCCQRLWGLAKDRFVTDEAETPEERSEPSKGGGI